MLELKTPERLDTLNATDIEDRFLQTIATEKPQEVSIDFSQTTYISSAGLRAVLVVSKKLRQQGAKLSLCSMNDAVYDIFKMAGFDTILDIQHQ